MARALHERQAQRLPCAVRAFVADERGAELVEWALVTVLVVLASLAALVAVRDDLNDAFTRVFSGFLGR